MAGVVLENLSSRKLYVLGAGLFILLAAFFLIGAVIAPAPSNVHQVMATKCILPHGKQFWDTWSIPRGEGACQKVDNFKDKIIELEHISSNEIVFSFWLPGPRANHQLSMTPWFQSLVSVLMMDIRHNLDIPLENKDIKLELKLGYRSRLDNATQWKSLAKSTETRGLDCTLEKAHVHEPGEMYKCALVSLFELGSVDHDFYLLNLRLPTVDGMNSNIGELVDLWMVAIHQNGGFTKVWISIKTFFFPTVLAAIVWYWRRIRHLNRSPTLLEKTLFAVGLSITFLNFPVEWLSIWTTTPFMLLYTDIRQGIFYAMLLSFWLIFVGEHSMDRIERKTLASYWMDLGAVGFGCTAMFVFEICERGIQLKNPFYSIWVTDTGRKLAMAFIIVAGICACFYFLFLSYKIFKVFRNISAKKTALPSMSSARRKYYTGVIFRFKFLMIMTLLCAAFTVIFFIISQVKEGQGRWEEEETLQYTSGFFTGVYGMWNVYVLGLLALYAPSYKYVPEQEMEDSREEELQLTTIPSEASTIQSEASAMASLVTKEAED